MTISGLIGTWRVALTGGWRLSHDRGSTLRFHLAFHQGMSHTCSKASATPTTVEATR